MNEVKTPSLKRVLECGQETHLSPLARKERISYQRGEYRRAHAQACSV